MKNLSLFFVLLHGIHGDKSKNQMQRNSRAVYALFSPSSALALDTCFEPCAGSYKRQHFPFLWQGEGGFVKIHKLF